MDHSFDNRLLSCSKLSILIFSSANSHVQVICAKFSRTEYDDVMTWSTFRVIGSLWGTPPQLDEWWGTHRLQSDSPHKSPVIPKFVIFIVICPNKLSNTLPSCWWLETLWRSRDVTIGTTNKTHNPWWSNQEPPNCPLDRVQNNFSDNGKLRKITLSKWIKHMIYWYDKTSNIAVLHTLN